VLIEAVGIFAVATVGGTAAGLNEGYTIWIGPEDSEEGFRMHGAGADFNVIGLLQYASLLHPKM
jgi:hypothetical protein